jgi:cell division protein FtsW (lipid II flippase)
VGFAVKTVRPTVGAGLISLFAILSLGAIATGCVVAAANGAPPGVWARNLVAWGIGGLGAVALARRAGSRTLSGFIIAAPLALAAGLLSAGQQGVHRWIDLGPLHMNVAEVLMPPAVVALGALAARPGWPLISAALTLALLIAQPDASQATALAGALLVIVALEGRRGVSRWSGIGLVVVAVAMAWLRRDPLAPVADVEGIMGLAWRLSPLAAVVGWIALASAASAPMIMSGSERRDVATASIALAIYGMFSVLTPLLGAFPVPLVGMGMSPILGAWLGIGLLAALSCSRQQPALP